MNPSAFSHSTRLLLVLVGCWLACMPAMAQSRPEASREVTASVQQTERSSISRFRINVDRVGERYQGAAAKAIAEAVELKRFDLNDLGAVQGLTLDELGRLVSKYLDAIKVERARSQAEFDARFKDEIITWDMLRRIVDSAFIYEATVTRYAAVKGRSSFVPGVQTQGWEATVAVRVQFWRVSFETGKVDPVATVKAEGTGFSPGAGSDARDNAVESALALMKRKLSTEVRNRDEFSLATNITKAKWNSVWFPGTKGDGIMPDTLYKVQEQLASGELVNRGWVKTRSVGDGKKEFETRAQVIAVKRGWALEGGELLKEYAQSGLLFGVEGGAVLTDIKGGSALGSAYDVSVMPFGAASFHMAANTRNVREFFYGARVQLGVAGGFIDLNLEPSIEKRFYLRRMITTLGLAVGYSRIFFADSSDSYQMQSFGVHPYLELELWTTPVMQLYARGGYRLYTDASDPIDSDGNDVSFRGLGYSTRGLDFAVGLHFMK